MYFVEAHTESDRPFAWLSEDELLSLLGSATQLLIARDRIVPRSKGAIYRDHWIWRPWLYAVGVYFPLFLTIAAIIGYLFDPLARPGFVVAVIAAVVKGYAATLAEFEEGKKRVEETRANAGLKELFLDLNAGQLLMHEHFSLTGELRTTSSPLSEVQLQVSHDIDDASDTTTESIEVRLDSFRLERASAWAHSVLNRSLRSYPISGRRPDQKAQAEATARSMMQVVNDRLAAAGHRPLTIVAR